MRNGMLKCYKKIFKGLVHPKMKILSLITHPDVVPNPWDLRSSSEHKLYFSGLWSCKDPYCLWEGQRALRFKQKYLNLCSEDERRSYRFGTTSGWVINDIILISGWTNPLTISLIWMNEWMNAVTRNGVLKCYEKIFHFIFWCKRQFPISFC